MTRSAANFVGPLTFQTITRNRVLLDQFDLGARVHALRRFGLHQQGGQDLALLRREVPGQQRRIASCSREVR